MTQSLTVLIPTKNRCVILAALLRRLESEDPGVVRVVVSDNCSDEPGYASAIPQACASHPLQVIYRRHETPLTALQNFESLLPFATTTFSCFLGDDDFWEEGALTPIAQLMNERGLDFVYAQEWFLHDRNSNAALGRFTMHTLHENRLRNIEEFIRYGNDPHVYGVFRSPLLVEMCSYFTPHWRLLPRSHIVDTAFTALVFVYLSTARIEWVPYSHSQGVASPDNTAIEKAGWVRRLGRRSGLGATAYHLIRKPQLYTLFLHTMSRMGCSMSERTRVLATCVLWYFAGMPVLAVMGEALSRFARKIRRDG